MSLFVILCVCLLQFVSVLGETDNSGIYAIGGYMGENGKLIESSLLKYDTISGNSTLLYKSDFKWTKNSKSCFDNKLNIWYFITQKFFNHTNNKFLSLETILVRYNLETNERLSDIKLEFFPWINYIDCVGNPNNGDIYLFGNNMYNNTMLLQLITSKDNEYSIEINKITDYGEDIFNSSEAPFVGIAPVFDSKRNRVWFNGGERGGGKMYYIDISTGDIIKEINFALLNTKFPFPRSAIYDEKLDKIIGLNYTFPSSNLTNGNWSMRYADPVSLDITNEMEGFTNYCPWYLHSPTIDIENNIFYEFVAEPLLYPKKNLCPLDPFAWEFPQFHLLGIDINTGQILTQPHMDGLNGTIIFSPSDIIFWNGE